MTTEEKDLLLKDLCTRLPYKPQIKFSLTDVEGYEVCELLPEIITGMFFDEDIEIRPYLRPMSSMTDEELLEFLEIRGMNLNSEELKTFREGKTAIVSTLPSYSRHIDWLNAHHFDYRGLIDKGLALKATENMYNQNY